MAFRFAMCNKDRKRLVRTYGLIQLDSLCAVMSKYEVFRLASRAFYFVILLCWVFTYVLSRLKTSSWSFSRSTFSLLALPAGFSFTDTPTKSIPLLEICSIVCPAWRTFNCSIMPETHLQTKSSYSYKNGFGLEKLLGFLSMGWEKEIWGRMGEPK